MSHEKDLHLSEEQIIQAVVDEVDLPGPLRDHLSTCSLCRAEKDRFLELLSQLGHVSKALSPLPRKKVVLPVIESPKSSWLWAWQWRRVALAGLSVAMVIAVLWFTTPFRISHEGQGPNLNYEILEDYQLMTEIVWLEEHALPQIYFDISGESSPIINEEFIQFLVPFIQNEAFYIKPKEAQYVV